MAISLLILFLTRGSMAGWVTALVAAIASMVIVTLRLVSSLRVDPAAERAAGADTTRPSQLP